MYGAHSMGKPTSAASPVQFTISTLAALSLPAAGEGGALSAALPWRLDAPNAPVQAHWHGADARAITRFPSSNLPPVPCSLGLPLLDFQAPHPQLPIVHRRLSLAELHTHLHDVLAQQDTQNSSRPASDFDQI